MVRFSIFYASNINKKLIDFHTNLRTTPTLSTEKGMGRHTRDEVNRMGIEDIRAVVDYLGNKKVYLNIWHFEIELSTDPSIFVTKFKRTTP